MNFRDRQAAILRPELWTIVAQLDGVSEITVSRYMPRGPTDPDQLKRWVAFMRNHNDAIAAMDFFTVPTAVTPLLARLDPPSAANSW